MEAIKVENLSKHYKEVKALNAVSLEIKENELYGLLGVNGAGKSTLIKILSCLIKPTEGCAYVLGHNILTETDYAKQVVNSAPQETAVGMKLTVYENLEFIARIYGLSKEETKNKIAEISKELDLESVLNKKASTLSGGWQRKLSIAMGIVSEPKVLFLDEPTVGLDVLARRELWQTINKLKNKMTIILTTHYLEEAEALCDRIAILVAGKIKAIGTVKDLKVIGNSDNFEDAFINIATKEEKL